MKELITQRVLRRLMAHGRLYKMASSAFRLLRSTCPLPPYQPTTELQSSRSLASSISINGPIFISGRFRSGTTLLWQIFERFVGYTAYYEPLNERRWFNPSTRGSTIDDTHRGSGNYWANYDNLTFLDAEFRESWTYSHLAMGPQAKDVRLVRYITALITAAPERPVLQFNRVDFRLGFLANTFPSAQVIHISRNPRDTWCSSLRGVENNPNWTLLDEEGYGRFYLIPWYRDLTISFPDLIQDHTTTHPYFIHYMIWRLAGLFALKWGHFFLCYEDLCTAFSDTMKMLLTYLGDTPNKVELLNGLMRPRTLSYRRDDGFYAAIEERVEQQLKAFLATKGQC